MIDQALNVKELNNEHELSATAQSGMAGFENPAVRAERHELEQQVLIAAKRWGQSHPMQQLLETMWPLTTAVKNLLAFEERHDVHRSNKNE